MSGQSCAGGFCRCCAGVIACVVLASLQALRCRLCWCCAGIVTNVALASLPSLCWHCPQHRKLASAQPRHSCDMSVCVASLPWSSSLPVASLPYLVLFHGDLASDGPVDAALVSLPALCWCPWLHCAGVITNIALLLLPALRRHHCPHCVGTFALVTLALLPSSSLRCHQHRKLASAQSQSSCDMCWRPCQHRAVDVASITPASLPLSRGRLCPCFAGVAALGTPASPSASQTCICPVMMQSQHNVGEALLWCSSLLPVASSLYPAFAHSNLAFDGLAKAAMAFFWRCAGVLARITLASLPASSCPCCRRCTSIVAELAFEGPAGAALAFTGITLAFHPHCADIIASIVLLSLLPALRLRHRPHHMGAFALVALASLPSLPLRHRQHRELASAQSQSSRNTRWYHCQHRAIVVASVAQASLPLLHGRLCPCPAGVAALGIPALLPASQTGLRPVMMQS
jgi:hypothetical protein